jgi:hypothetical protein
MFKYFAIFFYKVFFVVATTTTTTTTGELYARLFLVRFLVA